MFFVLYEVHQIVLLRLTLQMSLNIQGPKISGDQYQKSNTICFFFVEVETVIG